jgi:ketosteroid isomerase-like protein
MSEENVEVVRAAFQAWNAGDMDAFREMHDPDAILRPVKNWIR